MMKKRAQRKDSPPCALLKLPNELLSEIAVSLHTSDLRVLGHANRGLRNFVGDYLRRYRYNVGLVALPGELILEIARHLRSQKDCSHLARASQKFYPLIMDHIFYHNVKYGASSLLNYAAKRNLKNMTHILISLGGNVNTRCGPRLESVHERPTPLATASFYGHERIIKMLLERGASQLIDGVRLPLAIAILQRNETAALILSQKLESNAVSVWRSRGTVLQMACEARLVNLVRYYLERKPQPDRRDYSIALCRVLLEGASTTDFVRRELHHDVHRIVLMLLGHGASPEISIKSAYFGRVTARTIAARHPDPRVRHLFCGRIQTGAPRGTSPLIGRPWMSSAGTSITTQEPEWEMPGPLLRRYATLWELAGKSIATVPRDLGEDGPVLSSTSTLMRNEVQTSHDNLDSMESFPTSLSSQLGIAGTSAQRASQTFRTGLSLRTSLGPRVSQTSSTGATRNIAPDSRNSSEPATREDFPQLTRSTATKGDLGKDLWASFRSNRESLNIRNTEQGPHGGEDFRRSAHKSKRKKWQPLSI